MGTEKNIERNIRKKLTTMGYLTHKIHIGMYGPEGFPDLLVAKDGITSYFETKAPGETPTPIQLYRLSEFRRVGCVARPVWSFEDVMQALAEKNRREYGRY